MNPTEIEFAVRDLVAKPYDAEKFPYELIGIYNASKVTVSRLKSGTTNAAKQSGDVLWKKHLFFRAAEPGEDVGAIGDALAADPLTAKHKPRFIVVTNGAQVHARDLLVDDTLNVEYGQLDEKSDFLLPLAGFERRAILDEHPADIKAAKKLKKLYDAILAANPTWNTGHHTHELNLLMTRLLFCFYAEDTGIFNAPQIFTGTVKQYTSEDGGDVSQLLDRLFRAMNVEEKLRPKNTAAVETKFPYVNGSLFEDTVEIPKFSRTARRQLLECGDLDWTTINPDIFGSMIQTVAQDGTRSDVGMHYTSVPNIMKVLQPLFLDELHEAYEKAKDSVPKLEALLGRLSNIRVFDPACGSGNFLIIAYKELRRLEIEILNRISELAPTTSLPLSGVRLENFYGVDLVDFATETAKLSLWIAEHQMNSAFKEMFGMARPTLPLAKIATIHCGNSLRLNWLEVCPRDDTAETYVCGNPPYQGARGQTPDQKADISAVFSSIRKGYGVVDYVACWFIKLSDYIASDTAASGGFVATNSICQGEQVAIIWPHILSKGMAIAFAHTSFKWSNNASNNAGVTCVVVGLSPKGNGPRALFTGDYRTMVTNINPYLVPSAENLIVRKSAEPINHLPPAVKGVDSTASGPLMLSRAEKDLLLRQFPESAVFIRRFYGPHDFLYNVEQYVLWIPDDLLATAKSIPPIAQRLAKVQVIRKCGGQNARRAVDTPHRFVRSPNREEDAIIVPQITSERRQYLQVGLLSASDIADNKTYIIYSPPGYLFSILSSRLHRLWTEAVGGRLETRLSYTNTLVYNTFPIPTLSDEQRRSLTDHSRAILAARANHPGKTIAQLYNPETMPKNLLDAHRENDAYIEEYVYGRKYKDDTHRLEHLFALYAQLQEADEQRSFLPGTILERGAN